MPDISERTPFHRLVSKREKLRPTSIVSLRTDKPFHLAFRVDGFKTPDVVERRYGLGGLKNVAKLCFFAVHALDVINEYRGQFVQSRSREFDSTADCMADCGWIGVPFGCIFEVAFFEQRFQPLLCIPGFRSVAEVGDDVRINDRISFDTKC